MGQGIGWLMGLLLIAAMFWAIFNENSRRSRRTVADFERDVAAARNSLLRAGLVEIDKLRSDQHRAAIEYSQDEQQGMTRTGSKGDDAGRTDGEK